MIKTNLSEVLGLVFIEEVSWQLGWHHGSLNFDLVNYFWFLERGFNAFDRGNRL